MNCCPYLGCIGFDGCILRFSSGTCSIQKFQIEIFEVSNWILYLIFQERYRSKDNCRLQRPKCFYYNNQAENNNSNKLMYKDRLEALFPSFNSIWRIYNSFYNNGCRINYADAAAFELYFERLVNNPIYIFRGLLTFVPH